MLLRNGFLNPVVPQLLGEDNIENSLIYYCMFHFVHRGVAWQRGDHVFTFCGYVLHISAT
jgi:hypothetical protein